MKNHRSTRTVGQGGVVLLAKTLAPVDIHVSSGLLPVAQNSFSSNTQFQPASPAILRLEHKAASEHPPSSPSWRSRYSPSPLSVRSAVAWYAAPRSGLGPAEHQRVATGLTSPPICSTLRDSRLQCQVHGAPLPRFAALVGVHHEARAVGVSSPHRQTVAHEQRP